MKYFIVYEHGPGPESCNIFYSTLVIAEDETSAIIKYCLQCNIEIERFTDDDWSSGHGIQEMIPIV
jgi:hypothetical protein